MSASGSDCCILNGGKGAWAFDPLAQQLSEALGVPICDEPRRFNYVLSFDSAEGGFPGETFIPLEAIRSASDKRLTAEAFQCGGVPAPRTVLLDTFDDVREFLSQHSDSEWCLKFPTSCGANGHRMISVESNEPARWPRPFIVQEFIRLERPEVYRRYGAGEETFGWVARRFPKGGDVSPWVAHARGARYERAGEAPLRAIEAAAAALRATGLYGSFGCVDLLPGRSGEWLVLEVGTDGLYNHVDRDLDDPELERELLDRIAKAFWRQAST